MGYFEISGFRVKLRLQARLIFLSIVFLIPAGPLRAAAEKLPVVSLVSVPQSSIAIMGEGAEIRRQKPGWMIDLLFEVGRRTGVKFEFQRVPWKRCLLMIEKGDADATFRRALNPNGQYTAPTP